MQSVTVKHRVHRVDSAATGIDRGAAVTHPVIMGQRYATLRTLTITHLEVTAWVVTLKCVIAVLSPAP
jgi:hypothetical protein